MMGEELLEQRDGPILRLTLNRPASLNALSLRLRQSLAEAFSAGDADPEVRVIILTGAGDRAFSAGLDLKELSERNDVLATSNDVDPILAMKRCSKPIIGAVNGIAVTGGLELVLACDIVIASTAARFADTHMRVGVIPGWGLSQKLSRTIGVARAKSMSLTGRFIDAAKADAWGLVAAVVPPEALIDEAMAVARDIADHDTSMIVSYKKLIDDGYALSLSDGLTLELATSKRINRSFMPDSFKERRGHVHRRNRASGGGR